MLILNSGLLFIMVCIARMSFENKYDWNFIGIELHRKKYIRRKSYWSIGTSYICIVFIQLCVGIYQKQMNVCCFKNDNNKKLQKAKDKTIINTILAIYV